MEPKESCIFYADWLKGIEAIGNAEQQWIMAKYIITYSLTGEEIELPGYLKPLAAMMKPQAERANGKREAIIEKRRAAAYKMHAKQAEASKCMQNEQMHASSASACHSVSVSGSVSGSVEDKSSLKIIPPTPLGENGGLDLKGFGIFYSRVKDIQVPQMVEDSTYASQYIWRMAEGMPGFAKAVHNAMEAARETDGNFKETMGQICRRYKPSTEFGAVNVAMAMRDLPEEQVQAVITEINRAKGEQNLYETMMGKITHMKTGAKINSLAAFMKNRQ